MKRVMHKMTNFDKLEKLKIPSDLTGEQIFQLYTLTSNLSYVKARKKPDYVIEKRSDELTAWFMSQNFHLQVKDD